LRCSSWQIVRWSISLVAMCLLMSCSQGQETSAYVPKMPPLTARPHYFSGNIMFKCDPGPCVILRKDDWDAYKREIVTACIAAGETEKECKK